MNNGVLYFSDYEDIYIMVLSVLVIRIYSLLLLLYIIMFDDVLFCLSYFSGVPAWQLMYVSVQYNGGLLHDIMLLTQCYSHRGTRLNAIKRFCICSL